jgi:hypothetical protein
MSEDMPDVSIKTLAVPLRIDSTALPVEHHDD